jgi:hypothetical protein
VLCFYSFPEQRGPDSDLGCALFDGDFEIV